MEQLQVRRVAAALVHVAVRASTQNQDARPSAWERQRAMMLFSARGVCHEPGVLGCGRERYRIGVQVVHGRRSEQRSTSRSRAA